MNLRQLEFLVALAAERHFGRAAAACHVTQPALSMAIRRLEEELGLRLVQRGGGPTDLTPEGRVLLGHARRAVADVDGLAAEASRLRGRLTGTLRIGVIPTAMVGVAALVAPLARAHPGLQVEIRTRSAVEIASGIERHELDAGMTYVDDRHGDPRAFAPLYRERFVLLRSEHEGDEDGPLPWAAIAGQPLCLLPPDMQHRQAVDAALAVAGVDVRAQIEADTFTALLGLVRNGWPTIVGHTWLRGQQLPAGVRARPLVAPEVAPTVGLLAPDDGLVRPVTRALLASLEHLDLQARLGPLPE
ncbi:LysR family transcriptional regulator [Patulibacter defluvii]|uniref:LysR family transcriptional regulator n=1 Tax=Patulibacter defluvii TaxID=3095358 RepID=UPI002A7520BB|nr:LysR family transcriptional regulator [Patulibacter sp. DM4]